MSNPLIPAGVRPSVAAKCAEITALGLGVNRVYGYAIAQGHRLLTEAGFTLTEGPQHEAVGRTIMRLLG